MKLLRRILRLTPAELGERAGLSEATISDYENESCEPSLDTLIKLAAEFNVSVDWLLGREDMVAATFGQRLKFLRRIHRLTQAELGKMFDVSLREVSYYEHSIREPRIKSLIKLATEFNVSTDWLLGLETDDDGIGIERSTRVET